MGKRRDIYVQGSRATTFGRFSILGATLLFSIGEEKAGETIATGILDFEVVAPAGAGVVERLVLAFVGLNEVSTETGLVLKDDTPTAAVLPPVDLEVVELNTVAGGLENFEASLNVEVVLFHAALDVPTVPGSSTWEAASSKSPSSISSSGKSSIGIGSWFGWSTAN